MEHNPRRTGKALIAMRGTGGQVSVTGFASERHEAHWVAGAIADALAAGVAPAEILVLARTGYATQPVQAALAAAGIPHRVLGSLGLYERSEVRDAMAYLALAGQPQRRAGLPPRRAGPAAWHRPGDRQPRRRAGPRRARRRPDRRQPPRAAGSRRSAQRAARERLVRFGAALERVRERAARGPLARARRRRGT